jgi:PTS system nitrogen regulatory IIA component
MIEETRMNVTGHALTASCMAQESIVPGDLVSSVWHWVCPGAIELDVDARDKAGALSIVASMCERFQGLDAGPTLRALMTREEVGSTGLGQGIAIPHARVDGIDQPITLFVRLKAPIEYDAPHGKLVSQLFVILVPAQGSCDEHLELLASVAEMLSDRALRTRVGNLSTVSDVRRTFVDWIGDKVGKASRRMPADERGRTPRPTGMLRKTGVC